MKRAQGLPINTVILAVIGILILVVLLYITGQRLGVFGEAVSSCDGQGGACVDAAACNNVQSGIVVKGTNCGQNVCCKALIPQANDAYCAGNNDCVSKKCDSGTKKCVA